MRLKTTIMAGALLALTGCSFVDTPSAKSATGRAPTVAEVPSPDETVRGPDDPPIVTLELGSRLRERRLAKSEELPSSIIIPTTNLNAVPVTAALQAVLAGTDVSLSWEAGSFDDRLVTVTNLSGPLSKVVEKICASAKVFCTFRNGLLELKEKDTFIVELPAVPTLKGSGSSGGSSGSGGNSMADMIGELAGDKARVDQQGGNLIYTTDVLGQENVREYLTQLRHGRPLLVMQLYIWEVTLDSDKGTGINWSSFKFPQMGGNKESAILSGLTGFSDLTSPGVNLGAKFTGKVTADMVLKFLSTQGQVQTISNPQLTFVSGSNAEFRVGGKQRYISQVGQLTSVSGSSSSSTGVGTNTVSTDSLDTGLTVTMGGSFESGVISAMMELEMEDVVSLNPTTTESGVTVDLPETSERKVNTSLRVRPGDNLVLAGLVSSRDTNDREGVPLPFGARLTTFRRDQLKNSEIVILVKPSVVLFADSPDEPAKDARRQAKPAKPLPDALVIDKDGTRTMAMPQATIPVQAVAPSPGSAIGWAQPVTPELMAPAPALPPEAPLSDVPVAASADGAPVDRRLLQRGFSRAYDEMLSTASPSGEGGTR